MTETELLTTEQFSKILSKYLGTTDFFITNVSSCLMTEQYEGLIGEQHKLFIEYETGGNKKTQQFFVKILNGANHVLFQLTKTINAFEKESAFYETFIPLFQKEGIDVSFIPKCYLTESYSVALEDLSLSSYKITSKRKPLTLEHCKKCLETVAKFHAATILYEDSRSSVLRRKYRLIDDFENILQDKVYTDENTEGAKYFWCTYKGVLDYCEHTAVLQNGIDKKTILEKLDIRMNKLMSSNKKPVIDFRNTILHKDLWSNNFLFKYNKENKIIDAKLIDFQTITYGSPALDVMQFIMTNTRRAFRDKYVNDLLEHYYKSFSSILLNSDVTLTDDLSEVRFLESCEENKITAKIMALFDRSITGISDLDFAKAAETDESFKSFLFDDRGLSMIEAQKNDPTFREIMAEDILELAELLVEK